MSAPLYYLPGASKASRVLLEQAGLGYLLDEGEGPSWTGMSRGPDGGAGVVFAAPSPRGHAPQPAQAEAARWEQLPGLEAWLGVLDRPRPRDLERRTQLGGHTVRLADGQSWTVPVARLLSGEAGLPTALRFDGERWSGCEVVERYRGLWECAVRVWDQLAGAEAGQAISLDEEVGTAVEALAANYRLGPGEVSVLGLFDSSSYVEALLALVDWPAFQALKDAEGKAGAAGQS